MPTAVVDSIVHLLEVTFGHEFGSPLFNIMVGVCVFTWVLVARIFMAMFSAKRGIVAAFFALGIPSAIGSLAYGMAGVHAVPLVQADWDRAGSVLPWAAFGLFIFLTVYVFAKRILNLSAGVTIFVYIVATAAAIGSYFGAQVALGVIEYGEEQMELRDQRVKDEIDSLL